MKSEACNLIRPFRLRDIGLVLHLKRDGVLLDLETSLTNARSPLSTAFLSSILPFQTGTTCTFVIDQREDSGRLLGLAQMRHCPGRPEYVVVFVAPALSSGNGTHAIWQRLLTYLGVKAGERGGQRLYAGLPTEGEEYQIFRHAGFTAYAQEDVFQLVAPTSQLEGIEPLPLRRQRDRDSWGLQRLYATVTPRAVQNAEGSAQAQWELSRVRWGTYPSRRGYVWETRGEIMAAFQVRYNRGGHWLRMLLHPDALDRADALVAAALSRVYGARGQKLYCAVRTYEAGIPSALAAGGFEPVGSQMLVVKHTTVWARDLAVQTVSALEGHVEGATSAVPQSNVLPAQHK